MKPTIEKLEKILAGGEGQHVIEILPNGEIRALPALLEFGSGKFVVDTGKYGEVPAVFIRGANGPGGVGDSAERENVPCDCLQPRERVLTFPTEVQAKAVADALCGLVPCDVCGLQVDVQADACHHCG